MRKDGVSVNGRQKKFAEFYAESGNAAWSAVQAGYSQKFAGQNAGKLLKNTNIAEYIRELTEKAQDERILTARERQAMLSDVARGKYATQDRLRAIDILNKMTGEYVTKIEGSVSANVNNPFEGLSTEELRKLAGE
jgi:phage terminase small subunit